MKTKYETRTKLMSYIALVETRFHCKVKTARSDNGLKFDMLTYFCKKVIIHQKRCEATPQQNGSRKKA